MLTSLVDNFFFLAFFNWNFDAKFMKVFCGASDSPRHGSFFTRNSSSATQPPPTRTMTVLLRMRTRRSFWLSPNWLRGSANKLISVFSSRHGVSTHSVFPFADLEDPELLSARAQHHQTLDFVVDLVGVGGGLAFLPVGAQCRDEFLPVDESFAVAVEEIGDGAHFHSWCIEF